MLPYLYTLLYRAHNHGDTVVRPLMNNFPADKTTWDIDEQMQWGSGVMFSPVLEEGATKKRTYFPEARWYNYENGYEIGRSSDGWADVSAPLDVIPLYFQGGSVVPVQVPAQTTMDSRVNPLGLIVNLDKDGKASGDLYWDSGNSINPINTGAYTLVEFDFHHNQLQSSVKMGEIDTETHENYGTEHPLEFTHFEFNGIDGSVSDIVINGEILEKSAWKQEDSNRLVINDGFVKLSIIQQFDISIVVGDVNDRIDCTPGLENIGASECAAKGCTWSELPNTSGAPWCIHDSSKLNHGYTAPSSGLMTDSTESFSLSRPNELSSAKKFSDPVASPEVTMVKLSKNAFRMKIIADGRFEIPDEADIHQLPFEGTTSDSDYAVEYGNINDRFFFKVSRDGKDLIDSSHGPLIFEDQYLETSFALGSYNCYGLGEHNHRRFRHSLNWQRWAMFTRDVAPIDEWNFYGAQPFFMCGEGNSFFGVYFHNSNAQEAQFSPKPAITWRSTGGIFDISVVVADSAEELVQAYTSQIIGKPFLPPRWSLGYQLSRWGYDSLDKMKGIVEDMIAAEIPFDAQYGDIDYMDGKKDFTIDPVNYSGLADFVKELHEVHNMHYIVILDPAIANINPDTNKEYTEAEYPSYARAKAANLWINNPDGTPAQAEVWPGPTLFPDFTNMNATEPWWTDECRRFLDDEGVQYDALWIDMNEPASFMTDNGNLQCSDKWSNPPFMPNVLDADKGLFWKTICMDGVQAWGKHYDVHSLYGHSMALVTDKTLKSLYPDKRSFILTRSQFAGTGRVAGHWLGDNQSQWRQMQWSITGMLEYSLFGFSYTGADICGFWFAATAPMCQRWQQLGAFYPYSRNHNGIGWQDQHPTMFGDEVIESSRNALRIRYSLLPTLYTLMYESNQFGTTTVRSLMAEFPLDRNAADCSDQFLWGSGFMIAPVMEEHAVSRAVYFPADASWYDYHSYEEVEGSGKTKLIQADMMTIPLFARGGAFLTSQSPEVTTVAQRYNPITITYFMDKINPTKANVGGLFWDDGESLLKEDGDNYMKFNFNPFNGEFTSTCTASRCVSGGEDDLEIEKFVIVGVDRRLSSVLVNGQQTTSTFEGNTVTIDLSGIKISSEWSIVSPDLIQGSEDDNEGGGTAFLSTLTSSVITLLAYFLL